MAAIQGTTTLIELRDFLDREALAPPPWSTPQMTVDALFELLSERRDDDAFWASLEALASRLEDRRFQPEALAECEVLSDATIEGLLIELRRSLGDEPRPATSLRQWLGRSLSAAALTGFLILGTATGCDDDGPGDAGADGDVDGDADGDAGGDADADDALCGEAINLGLQGAEGDVVCDLLDVVDQAGLSSGLRSQLLSCLPELSAVYRAELLEQFSTMTEEQLAAHISGMYDSGGVCFEDSH